MAQLGQIPGLREALLEMRRLDKTLYKEARKDMKKIMGPTVKEIKAGFPKDPPISGMGRRWTDRRGTEVFPYVGSQAKKGVKLRWRLSKNNFAFLVEQTDPAGQVFDDAGKGKQNALAASLSKRYGQSWRVMYRVIEKNRSKIEDDLETSLEIAQIRLNGRLRK